MRSPPFATTRSWPSWLIGRLFHPPIRDCAPEFKGLATLKQKTDYYSQGPASYNRVFADFVLVEFVQWFSLHNCIEDLWRSQSWRKRSTTS